MKLSFYELAEPIEFVDGKINTLIIEEPLMFRSFIAKLIEQSFNIGADFVLSDGLNILYFQKSAEIITDIFRLAFDSRAVTAKVNQAINAEIGNFGTQSADILMKINSLASEMSASLDFDASFNELNDLSGVLKLLNFSVDYENMTLPERLLQYIDFYCKYFKRKLFVIVNLKACFSANELKEFEKTVKYKKINVLLIENCFHEKISDDEIIRIIDKDLCEF